MIFFIVHVNTICSGALQSGPDDSPLKVLQSPVKNAIVVEIEVCNNLNSGSWQCL
jgi:hypothetical protein